MHGQTALKKSESQQLSKHGLSIGPVGYFLQFSNSNKYIVFYKSGTNSRMLLCLRL